MSTYRTDPGRMEERTARVLWRGVPVTICVSFRRDGPAYICHGATVNGGRFRPWSSISGTDLQSPVLEAEGA